MLYEEFLETELFEKTILHSSSLWWIIIYNEIWSFASAKAAFLPRVPQSSKQWSWCYASPERVLGSMPPKTCVKSQAVVGELLVCACWACGKTQHLRTITPEGICRTLKWTCWKWYDTHVVCLACPFSLFPSPYATWGSLLLRCWSYSGLTTRLTDHPSLLMLSLFYCRRSAVCLCPVEKLCGERALDLGFHSPKLSLFLGCTSLKI